ncbi:MAG: archaellar assembly protein FlaJ [Archaeoglobus sp.]|uniref:archaellar assembly protein FlaJ n=1 Tax=Archaeoglobus sp. TaxID=1872626 RepID=UPI001DDACCA3|nr:archaellar assembly protein FlaJ [Archaeoglobus sp.]MBO8180630.1 archaellar assembly protein FlaJ [Archaeoglobus sp.]
MEVKTVKVPKLSAGFGKFGKVFDILKSSGKDLLMDNDLLFTLTYMASLSTANLSRDKIFEMVSEKKEYAPSRYFSKVKDLTQKWHYDYATACDLIAEKIRHERLKKLFNRMANAIAAGEPDNEFLEREWRAFKTIRKDEYERNLESLRKWSDAYTSLLVSASLISVVVLLSVVIYSTGDPGATLIASAFGNFAISLFGVFMLFKAVPKDKKVHDLKIKSKEQATISKLVPLLLPIALMAVLFLTILPTLLNLTGGPGILPKADYRGLGFLLAGLVLLPVGYLAKVDDKKISMRDEAFTSFIRSLGAIKAGAGVSVAEALSRIDQKNLGELRDLVIQLYRRLSMGLDARLSWERFVGESGSYLISKLTAIFVDATDLGGDADVVGEIVSSSNLEMVLLRLKRDLISSGFINLIIPLHLAMVALVLFITQILSIFSEYISNLFASQLGGVSTGEVFSKIPGGMQGLNIGIFSGIPTDLLSQYSVWIILSLTIANTLAANVVKGGGRYLYLYYGAIFAILSGLLMLVVPPVVEWAFTLPSFVE